MFTLYSIIKSSVVNIHKLILYTLDNIFYICIQIKKELTGTP